MSVAEMFANFDANTMFDNALSRTRRVIGVRELPSSSSVREYLNAQGILFSNKQSLSAETAIAANESVVHAPYRESTVGRRWARRDRRASRA